MVPLMKSTASSNWDKALCYKPDFRQAMLWFHFDFQTLIYLISFFSVWTWSRQSASTEDVPKKKKKKWNTCCLSEHSLGNEVKDCLRRTIPGDHPCTRTHTCTQLYTFAKVCMCAYFDAMCTGTKHTCMHACMQEGIHLHTMLKIQLSPTPVSVALAACVCVIRL